MGRLAITKATAHKTESGAAEISGGHTVFVPSPSVLGSKTSGRHAEILNANDLDSTKKKKKIKKDYSSFRPFKHLLTKTHKKNFN